MNHVSKIIFIALITSAISHLSATCSSGDCCPTLGAAGTVYAPSVFNIPNQIAEKNQTSANSGSFDFACNFACNNSSDCNNCSPLRTGIHYRSQGANTARELVGWQWDINKPEMCQNYGAFYVAFEYQNSFNNKHIAQALFGSSKLTFAGSQVANRPPTALIADNFGLARGFLGTIHFAPQIKNYIVDLGFYIGLDYWVQNLYLRFHAPIVHTIWDLHANCETIISTTGNSTFFDPCFVGTRPNPQALTPDPGSLPALTEITPGTFGSAVLPVPAARNIQEALSGNFLFGDMQTPWCAGKFPRCAQKRTGLADIDVIIGYNWFNDDCYHLGGYIQAVLPTGGKRHDIYVFAPVVGNGGHFELGVGLSGHSVLWANENSNLALFLEGNVTHLFSNKQCRLFDFCSGRLFSRYLLLKEFDFNSANTSYNNNIISATCFNTRKADVSIGVKGDASLKIAYRRSHFGIDIGYNIYGHSAEKVRFDCNLAKCNYDSRHFGIKGTEGVCCFNYPIVDVIITTPTNPSGTAVPTVFPAGSTYASAVGTTLFGGTVIAVVPHQVAPLAPCTSPGPVSVVTALPNNGVQPAANAFYPVTTPTPTIQATDCSVCLANNSATVLVPTSVSALTPDNGFIVANSVVPPFVSINDLNARSAEAPAWLTHKFFGFINYSWSDCCLGCPEIGIGAEIEFTGQRRSNNSCRRTGIDQWGLLIKGSCDF